MIGVGACGRELSAFSAMTRHQTCRRELISLDKQSQVNTDALRLHGEMHAKAVNHVVNKLAFSAIEVKDIEEWGEIRGYYSLLIFT